MRGILILAQGLWAAEAGAEIALFLWRCSMATLLERVRSQPHAKMALGANPLAASASSVAGQRGRRVKTTRVLWWFGGADLCVVGQDESWQR